MGSCRCLLLFAVNEDDAFNYPGQELGAVESPPTFLSSSGQLPDHREGGLPGSTAFGALGAQADGGEGAFDGIARPQMRPMSRGKGLESEEDILVLAPALASLRVFGLV